MQYEVGNVTVRKRQHLPHWDVEHGIYFVTWHLADAVPRAEREAIDARCDWYRARLHTRPVPISSAEIALLRSFRRRLINRALDKNLGSCLLRDDAGQVVADALLFFDDIRYRLFDWCVMPNHVHVIFALSANERLDRVLHSWKSFTAKKVNEILGRSGQLWHDDYFDTTMRNSRQLQRTIDYVHWNPEKAGLAGWTLRGMYPERIQHVI